MSDRRRWTIVCLLMFGMLIAYVDRANISVVLATRQFKDLFHLSDAERGAINSSFFWSYALLQIPAGFLVDRFGVKAPYIIGFLLWSGVSAGTSFAGTIEQILILRMMLGIGESVVTPASLRWIRFNVVEARRGLALAVYFAGTKLGPAVGATAAALLIESYGWRAMFVILGLGGLVWLIPWIALVRNDDRQLEAVSARSSGAPVLPFSAVMKTPAIWGVIIGTFCYNYFVYFSMTWLPAYLVERRHLSLNSMGLYTMFSFGGMALVSIFAGWAADTLIARGGDAIRIRKAFTIAGFVVASSEVVGAMSSSTSVAVLFAVISLAGLGLATANYWALTQTLLPGAAIGSITGVQNCASNMGGVVAPLLTGWLKQVSGGYSVPMQAIWLFLIAGIGAYIFLVRPEYAPKLTTAAVPQEST
ncbi:MAG TPA: MFS transporter [Bryobacteraceae bacterium]|nr:MFS transporter [Bryobacteraceae bacterium]